MYTCKLSVYIYIYIYVVICICIYIYIYTYIYIYIVLKTYRMMDPARGTYWSARVLVSACLAPSDELRTHKLR